MGLPYSTAEVVRYHHHHQSLSLSTVGAAHELATAISLHASLSLAFRIAENPSIHGC